MQKEIKEILQKFNAKVKNVELIRNPYSSEDKKIKKILIYLEEDHCDIFKNILDCITNLQEENEKLNNIIDELEKYIKTEAKVELYGDKTGFRTFADVNDILNKLNELKGDNK